MESIPSIIVTLTPLLVSVVPTRDQAIIKMLRSLSQSISQSKRGQLLIEVSTLHQHTRRVRHRELPEGYSMNHQRPHFWLQEPITPKSSQLGRGLLTPSYFLKEYIVDQTRITLALGNTRAWMILVEMPELCPSCPSINTQSPVLRYLDLAPTSQTSPLLKRHLRIQGLAPAEALKIGTMQILALAPMITLLRTLAKIASVIPCYKRKESRLAARTQAQALTTQRSSPPESAVLSILSKGLTELVASTLSPGQALSWVPASTSSRIT